jgi:hypothetical protein
MGNYVMIGAVLIGLLGFGGFAAYKSATTLSPATVQSWRTVENGHVFQVFWKRGYKAAGLSVVHIETDCPGCQ